MRDETKENEPIVSLLPKSL